MNILHVTTHLGGGVGTVLLNWVEKDKNNSHRFICLGYNFDDVINKCNKKNIELYNQAPYSFVEEYLQNNKIDIVLVHYWNHPLLVEFLVKTNLPSCRLVIYSHTAGVFPPYVVPKKLEAYADRIIYTSLSAKGANGKNVIMSTGGVEKYKNVIPKMHNGFHILYVGTLDFSKLRNNFVEICSKIIEQIPEAHFIVCGDGFSKDAIMEQAKELDIYKNFTFTGLVQELVPYFEIADVFLYPLSATHYGTGEQVLGEAMTSGIVPIVFNNLCEKQIVKNMENGLVVENLEECVNAVNALYKDKEMRLKISDGAKCSTSEMYSVEKFISNWSAVFKEVLKIEKRQREWIIEPDFKEYEIGTVAFLESLGEESESFKDVIPMILIENKIKEIFNSSQQWESDSKGSIKQYLKHFPNDVFLNKLQKILKDKS